MDVLSPYTEPITTLVQVIGQKYEWNATVMRPHPEMMNNSLLWVSSGLLCHLKMTQ